MGLTLPYSDRYDDDVFRSEAAWDAYWKSLEAAGLYPEQPVYRYFVGDAFHDSPIGISMQLDHDTPNVTLNMRNIRLLDEFSRYYEGPFERPDFHCDVTFVGCHHLQFNLDLTRQYAFQWSAINKVGGLLEVVIAVHYSQNEEGEFDNCIRLVAEDVQVEDITGRLSERYEIAREEIEQLLAAWHRS